MILMLQAALLTLSYAGFVELCIMTSSQLVQYIQFPALNT